MCFRDSESVVHLKLCPADYISILLCLYQAVFLQYNTFYSTVDPDLKALPEVS